MTLGAVLFETRQHFIQLLLQFFNFRSVLDEVPLLDVEPGKVLVTRLIWQQRAALLGNTGVLIGCCCGFASSLASTKERRHVRRDCAADGSDGFHHADLGNHGLDLLGDGETSADLLYDVYLKSSREVDVDLLGHELGVELAHLLLEGLVGIREERVHFVRLTKYPVLEKPVHEVVQANLPLLYKLGIVITKAHINRLGRKHRHRAASIDNL